MLSFKLSFFLAFFLWAFTLEAAPAMHHHRHGNQHLRHLHATRAALLHRARSHYHHGAPQVLFEEPQKPSQSLPGVENEMLSICSTVHDDTHSLSLTSGSNLENLSLGVDSRIPFLFISVSIPIFPPSSSAQHPSRPIFLSLSFSSFSTLLNHRYPRQSCCSSINSNRSSRDAQELLTRARSLAHPPLVPRSSSRRDAFSTPRFDSHHDAETYTGQEFIKKTQNAMSANEPPAPIVDFATGEKAGQPHADKDGDGDIDADDQKLAAQMQERLKAAEAEAKGKANEKGGLRPDPPKKVVGVGSSAEGQDKDKIVKPVGGVSGDIPAPAAAAEKKPETETRSKEAIAAREELDSILKKSPVIIFSKTYCPFSKRAKSLLIEKYSITPEPYVVELDIHPQGQALQDQLLETTGRRTVPNIMVNGVSLGGADDITEMDQAGKLVGKIVDLGNKRVEVLERTK
ncbi:hypothetical protein IWW34DRAFT_799469 [Fusarium oxysporum f. sp. albedinis]|nr:hypothetical protein IWW34DRAFT_799469 [Fusarium oxysporum f. sp. albedinis]